MSEQTTATITKVQEISLTKSYVVGIPRKDSTTMSPSLGSEITYHGSMLRKNGIKSIVNFIENKKLGLIPRKTYQVYELDEDGRKEFFGQFSPEIPQPPRRTAIERRAPLYRPSSLNDNFSGNAENGNEVETLLPLPARMNANGNHEVSNRTIHELRESQTDSLRNLKEGYNLALQAKDAEIARMSENFRAELERLNDAFQVEILSKDTHIAKLEQELDTKIKEYFAAQNEALDAKRDEALAKAETESMRQDYARKLKQDKDRFDFEIEKRDRIDAAQKKFDAQNKGGLNDGNWIEDVIQLVGVAKGLFGGDAPTGAPTARPIPNPSQNLNGTEQQQTAPPKPIRPSLPVRQTENTTQTIVKSDVEGVQQ